MRNLLSEKRLILVLTLLCAVTSGFSWAASPPLQEVFVHEGFEESPPNVTEWADNGPSTVSFSGVTDERAFEGK
ncbi:MAG: hypothetical protein R6V12_17470, partial [Candidatus Hydrogenedentota bacterium]